MKTSRQNVQAVHRAMARFPMILEILQKLNQAEIPFPGDDDIRHGCERAITAVLVDLAKIPPAPPGAIRSSEETFMSWLRSEAAVRLVNADQLLRLHQFIERVLGKDPKAP
jgi:hypothetical protein